MAQVKLNLQPPPNVEFVTGYPGIPPGSDRPQAAVKGAIEVRIPPQGIKAKWVRIELRKVEILPGGGAANTFYDFVGPSPVNLWSSPDEYSLLRSQDFPFSIRIPESIPPTVLLDGTAGIGYELVASVCTKGKRGFLRKAKSVVVSTISPITIDKHELHSTWPVYCQPETRHVAQDGVNLSVQRNNTCYGPGDRISVTVTVKSDSVHSIIFRTLELSLKETTVFRAGALGPGKRVPPQERRINIAESKVPVNITLYGGSSHGAELSCLLSPAHTTTTLNAARHIDITYTICIKALLSTGAPLVMELPVIISNWQRNVSHELISRIGPAPSLSLLPAGNSPIITNRGRPTDAVAATLPSNRPNFVGTSGSAYNSLPGSSRAEDGVSYGATRFGNGLADEFGSTRPAPNAGNVTNIVVPPLTTSAPTTSSHPAAGRRPDSSAGGGNRFTVTNLQPHDIPRSTPTPSRQLSANASGSGPSSGSAQQQWPRAEEEKLRLYEQARAQVVKVQGLGSTPASATVTGSPSTLPLALAGTPSRVAATAVNKTTYMSAEEEKLRLFEQAQLAAQKTQGIPYTAPPPTHARNDSESSNRGQSSGSGKPTAAATLYAQAINAQGRSAGSPGPSASTPPRTKPTVPQYLTADQEKAALRRYEEAKRAVDRTQTEFSSDVTPGSSAPIAYESLFPAAASSSSRPSAPDQPPPFNPSVIPQSHLSEKERLRRAYEANDAAARARQNASPTPPPLSPPSHGQYTSALEEKEALRRKFEERDNAQAKGALVPQTPPRNGSFGPGTNSAERSSSSIRSPSAKATGSRPTPLPPTAGASSVLTAAEEKALLRAKLEARDAQTNRRPAINGNYNLSAPLAPTTPPPLMPRPPVEYIKETQEEDARVSRLNDGGGPVFDSTPSSSRRGTPKPQDPKGGINGRSQADI